MKLTAMQPRGRRKGKSKQFYNLKLDAFALGVSQFHLWCVLTQRRSSPILLAKYENLVNQRRENKKHEPSCQQKDT